MPAPWQRALIVGASSGIGAALARQLAAQGVRVALVARRAAELAAVAAECAGQAQTYPHDVTHYDEVPGLFQQICRDLGGLDLVIYAAGIYASIGADEYDFAKDRAIVEVNLIGAIAWLNEVAVRFTRAGAGTLVGISSVAGDRGRRGNPAYHAAKAGLTTYLEALRNRLGRHGVAVVTVKPGPVDTAMTQELAQKPLMISAEEAARGTLAAARRGATNAYVPAVWRPIMFAVRGLPSAIMRRLNF